MLKKYFKYVLLIVLLLSATAMVVNKFAKHEYLNFLAKYYFDEKYYLAEYPEVKDSGFSAYDHYIQIGWKENKNPSAEFDTKLYRNLYFTFGNKYNLNPLAHYVDGKIKLESHFINVGQIKKTAPLENSKYYLSLVALFRDEARFLKEWIEFYRMIGVEHFYLYNHLSTDNYLEILQPYIDQGIVELRHLYEPFIDTDHFVRVQGEIYSEISTLSRDVSEWLMIVDTDEFLFPVNKSKLSDALKNYDEYAALSVNWTVFGSGGVQKVPSDKLMIESLLYKEDEQKLNRLVKTIIKPRYVKKITNPHYPKLKSGYFQINENFEYFSGPFIPEETRNIFRLNHYWHRDWDFFLSHKINRVALVRDSKKQMPLTEEEIEKGKQAWIKKNKNTPTTYDDAILKYVPELRKRVFKK